MNGNTCLSLVPMLLASLSGHNNAILFPYETSRKESDKQRNIFSGKLDVSIFWEIFIEQQEIKFPVS